MSRAAGAAFGVAMVSAALVAQAPPPQNVPLAPLSGQPPVEYALGPESQPQEGVPKGTITKHELAPGKFYPGTPHTYQIYVPAQYDASRATPFMVFMDGNSYAGDGIRIPVVFDNLIAKKDIPPMIGIFVNPGVLPALTEQSQNRYARNVEYETLTPRFANFLADELIPEVGKRYNLSKDPSDRGVAGSSSGAIAAFVAAWERPDQFRRVLTLIGSFINERGADRLASLVRRTEPRPMRVVLQTGRQDLNNYSGSQYLENPRIAAALEYAGYDYRLEIGEDAHNSRHGASIMPDLLRWLWRDYPQPIVVKEPVLGGGRGIFAQLVPRRELIVPPARQAGPARGNTQPAAGPRGFPLTVIFFDKGWEQIGGTYTAPASPVADKAGNVYFADPAANVIYRSDSSGSVVEYKRNTRGARALRVGGDGRLYAVQPAARRIVSYGDAEEKIVASNIDAHDLALTASGEIYFIDASRKSVGHIDAKGRQRVVYGGTELMQPSALALTPDQAFLIVADRMNRYMWSFQVAADGSLTNGQEFHRLEMAETAPFVAVEGLAVDTIGHIWTTTALGIQVCEQPGRCGQILNKPELGPTAISNIAFGGPERNWIYVTQGSKIFRRPVKRVGVVPWELVKPPQPGL